MNHPAPTTVEALDDLLTTPNESLLTDLATLDGDLMVIGGSGKMGPTLSLLAQRALDTIGKGQKVVAVSRFSNAEARAQLDAAGITTISADLQQAADLAALPNVPNIVYMLGTKFGTQGREYQTWAVNTQVAGTVAQRFADSRFTVFSSGNIYPFQPLAHGGADEQVVPDPVGEYAQSCLARERLFEYASRTFGTKVAVFRLNYAIDLRYGVLHDIGSQVFAGQAVDVTMGDVNVIWQGDANGMALRMLTRASSPPEVFNVTGPETVSTRWLVGEFARRFGVEPLVAGEEAPSALLSNSGKAFATFGYPSVALNTMIDWVAGWIQADGPTLNKPTHFQERQGNF